MSLPFAPYPPSSISASIPPSEWLTILSIYASSVSHLLRIPSSKFIPAANEPSLHTFLATYLTLSPQPPPPEAQDLRHKTFQLLHRLLTLPSPPKPLLERPEFFFGFLRIYGRLNLAKKLLSRDAVAASFRAAALSAPKLSAENTTLLLSAFAAEPRLAAAMLAGDEFAETMSAKVYAAALMSARKANWSVVIDGLYALHDKALLEKLAAWGVQERLLAEARETDVEGRVEKVAEKVRGYGGRRDKGKGRAVETAAIEEVELRSKVDAIRELFPDLGDVFVMACLRDMGGGVEVVTSALLEDKLPENLKGLDRGLQVYTPQPSAQSTRRNVFDNDELDRLDPASTSKLTVGRRHDNATADELLDTSRLEKSAILSALAAIDLDDDERDDTYDAADVGGAIEAATEIDKSQPGDEEEKRAWNAYKASPSLFARTERGGNDRKKLKEDTGWTDEALEGFAIMLQREPERERKLERKYKDDERVQQKVIERRTWEDGNAGRGRGHGRGRGGPSQPPPPGQEGRGRARKEQSKGRVANHSRRNQRAKKVARAGFSGVE